MMNEKTLVIDKVDNDVQPLDSYLKITTPIPEQVATEIPPAAPERSSYQWYVVIICMVAYILSFVDRQILSLMIEPIKADLMLSDTQFSLLQGLAFSLFYAFMGVPIAALADKKSRVKIISVGIAFWSLATAACGLSKNFIQMFLARLSVGAGEAALSPAFYSIVADLFPKHKLGRALGVYAIGAFIGSGLAFLIGGYVIGLLEDVSFVTLPVIGEIKTWQLTFMIVGLPGVLLALLMILTVREPERKGLKMDANGVAVKASFKNSIGFIKTHKKTFFCHFIGFSFYTMMLYSLLGWAPAYYMRHFGLDASQTGYILGSIILVANTSGALFCGWLIDFFSKRGYSDAAIRAGAIGCAALIIPSVLFTQVDNMQLSFALIFVAMFFSTFPIPASAATTQMLTPNQLRSQVSAKFLLISNLIALGVGTTAVALITDRYYENTLMVGNSISIVNAIAGLIGVFLLYKGCQYYRESMKVEKLVD
ncbi:MULTISPECIES: spinster family MFS transporter [Acinetobacter]|uniref:spinster family MFS transporter n=1 Tax=Acinetobacter TaxID=469 RepID=UPI00158E05BA|nr:MULTISPECIES: MFS transporter [Acinetobacter]MCU4364006.1 MFS transporter [Acinetobacter variabilis]MCU4374057.1 MFS transporter [Acinetobacter variabilis]QKW82155.1 MFS transporter [Acinetobacter sp. FDAARGOS_724]